MQILEAFRALNALNEDVFDLDADGIQKLSDFKQNDDFEDDISIIDPEAETEEELQDNYIGKIILDCCTCHSKLYKAKEEVNIDENGELANVGEECPYCFTPDGFKVIGEVAAFEAEEDKDEDKDEDDSIDELLDVSVPVNANITANGNDVAVGGMTESAKGTLEEGIFGIKTKKEKATEAKAKADREAKRKADKEAEERSRRYDQQFAADSWKRADNAKRNAQAEYNRSRRSSSSSSTSNTGRAGVHYSGGDYYSESLKEDIQDLSMTANDTHLEVTEEENGKVVVSMEPVTANGGETIEPISSETEAELLGGDEIPMDDTMTTEDEAPVEEDEMLQDDEIEVPIDEVDEDTFDESLNSYFRRVYENVKSYKTTAIKSRGNSMMVEGQIKFESGKTKNTSFLFEAKDATRSGKVRFVGDNKQLTEGKKAFVMTGRVADKKLVVESMSYNYSHKDADGKASMVRGASRVRSKRV